jgi:hypothetical protein
MSTTLTRSTHDVGLASWLGGSLLGAGALLLAHHQGRTRQPASKSQAVITTGMTVASVAAMAYGGFVAAKITQLEKEPDTGTPDYLAVDDATALRGQLRTVTVIAPLLAGGVLFSQSRRPLQQSHIEIVTSTATEAVNRVGSQLSSAVATVRDVVREHVDAESLSETLSNAKDTLLSHVDVDAITESIADSITRAKDIVRERTQMAS